MAPAPHDRAGTVKSRTMGMGGSDGLRRNALVGGIGSMPAHIRKAYNRRVRCNCTLEATTYPYFVEEPDTYAEAGENYNFNELLKKFFNFLVQKRRLFFIEKILRDFLVICSNMRGEILAKLTAAKDLKDIEINEIKNLIKKWNNFWGELKNPDCFRSIYDLECF